MRRCILIRGSELGGVLLQSSCTGPDHQWGQELGGEGIWRVRRVNSFHHSFTIDMLSIATLCIYIKHKARCSPHSPKNLTCRELRGVQLRGYAQRCTSMFLFSNQALLIGLKFSRWSRWGSVAILCIVYDQGCHAHIFPSFKVRLRGDLASAIRPHLAA